MNIVNVLQHSDAWLEWRRQGVTATDAAILLNRSPYKTPWRLWAEKTGYANEEDLSANPLVQNGIAQEDAARRAFEQQYNDLLLPVCVESSEHPFIRASLDGLNNSGEPVELKCPSETVWNEVRLEKTNSAAYQLYYIQVQHQLLATGASQGWLVFYCNQQIATFQINRDEPLIQTLLDQAQIFWQQVKDKQPPAKDPQRDLYVPQGQEMERWITAAEEYRLYDAEIQALKKRLAQLQERQKAPLDALKSLMGDYYHADFCGVMVTRYLVVGKVDYKRVVAETLPPLASALLESYREATTDRYRVTVTGSVKPRDIIEPSVLAPLEGLPDIVETSYW